MEGNRLLRIVRRSSGSVVTWRRTGMVRGGVADGRIGIGRQRLLAEAATDFAGNDVYYPGIISDGTERFRRRCLLSGPSGHARSSRQSLVPPRKNIVYDTRKGRGAH